MTSKKASAVAESSRVDSSNSVRRVYVECASFRIIIAITTLHSRTFDCIAELRHSM